MASNPPQWPGTEAELRALGELTLIIGASMAHVLRKHKDLDPVAQSRVVGAALVQCIANELTMMIASTGRKEWLTFEAIRETVDTMPWAKAIENALKTAAIVKEINAQGKN